MNRFNKSTWLIICAFLFVVSGCLGNGVETAETKEIKHVMPIIPTITLGTPDTAAVNSTGTSTIAVSITDADDAASTFSSANVGLNRTGTANCLATVIVSSDALAHVQLHGCTGDGTVSINIKSGAVKSTTNTPNDLSSNSGAVTVDNTGPTVVSFLPVTGPVSTTPTTLTITFNEAVDPTTISAARFSFNATGITGGACSVPPTYSSKVMSGGNTVATVTLTAGTCTDGQGENIVLNLTGVKDILGNAGVGSHTETYTDSDGPITSFGGWSSATVRNGTTTSITANFNAGTHANVVTPAISSATVGVTYTGGAGGCTIGGSGISTAGATITLSSCTGNGTAKIFIKAGVLQTVSGIPNAQSTDSPTFTVDNTPPTLSTLSPANSLVNAYPSVVAVYSEALDPTTVTATDVGITGTCTSLPSVNTITPSGGNTTYTITFTGGTCADTQNMVITMGGTGVTDAVGNASAAGGTLARTYTFDHTAPSLVSVTPATATVTSRPASLVATFNEAMDTSTFTNADFILNGSSTCSSPPTVGAPVASGGNTIFTSALTGAGSCTDGQTLVYDVIPSNATDVAGNAGSGATQTVTYTFDLIGPNVIVTGVSSTTPTVTATFNEAVSDMTSANFSVSGCTVNPSKSGFAGPFSGPGTTKYYTVDLSGGTCNSAETLTVTVDATAIHDLVGHAGTNMDSSSFTVP